MPEEESYALHPESQAALRTSLEDHSNSAANPSIPITRVLSLSSPASDISQTSNSGHNKEQVILNLRLLRGPLPEASSRTILEEYNRQTASRIPFHEFIHWTQKSPEGSALHAILESPDGGIAGHQCLFPIRGKVGAASLVGAKSEYTFLKEEYRSTRISGYAESSLPTHLLASRLLYEKGEALGWSPILISTLPFLYRWARTVGCTAVQVPVHECLLVLRPLDAARRTLNLGNWQRMALGMIGAAQSVLWKPGLLLTRNSLADRMMSIEQPCSSHEDLQTLSFFLDPETLRWRYLNEDYERIAVGKDPEDHVIVKSGSEDGYVRVCQWNLSPEEPSASLLLSLAKHAERKKAFGLRWAVYGKEQTAVRVVSKMRRMGFLCAKRVRTLLVRSKDRRFLEAANWDLSDAMFNFHH